ncbi:MAG: hypothetical protein PHW13_09270 [Methylococcales bacterium]|nr:hypothetical protein [Methylococcales bacterium]
MIKDALYIDIVHDVENTMNLSELIVPQILPPGRSGNERREYFFAGSSRLSCRLGAAGMSRRHSRLPKFDVRIL